MDNSENPYGSPEVRVATFEGDRETKLDRFARGTIVLALLYTVGYVPYFVFQVFRLRTDRSVIPVHIIVPHFIGMVINLMALVMTLRDLYFRQFATAKTKLTWLILILMTGGIGWLMYVLKYPLQPRDNHR